MKILILVRHLPPEGRSTGRLALEYGKLLLSRGAEVTLLTAASPGGNTARRREGLMVEVLPDLPFLAPASHLQATLDGFRLSRCAVERPELVYSTDAILSMDWSTAIAASALKRAYRKPLVQFYGGAAAARTDGNGRDVEWIGEMEGWALERADCVVVPSDHATKELRSRFAGFTRDVVLASACATSPANPVVVDHEEFRRSLASQAENIVLWVGAGRRRNGFDLFLGCLPEVLFRNPRIRVVIAGQPPGEAKLVEEFERVLKSGRVRALGEVGDAVLEGLLQVADLLVAPSRYDPSGIGILHSALRGVPIITTPTPVAIEAKEGGCPVSILDGDDAFGLAHAILATTESRSSRSLNSRAVPNSVSSCAEVSSDQLERVFRSVIARRNI